MESKREGNEIIAIILYHLVEQRWKKVHDRQSLKLLSDFANVISLLVANIRVPILVTICYF